MDRAGYTCIVVAVLAILVGCGDSVTGTTTSGAGGDSTGPGNGPGNGSGGGGNGSGANGTGASAAGGNGSGGLTAAECFADKAYPFPPDYDAHNPVVGSHCLGTNHQDISGVERLVILGDSISQGTPPTPASGFYRTVLGEALSQTFPGVAVDECANNDGARVGDLLEGGDMQIQDCFPDVEQRKTLVVLTIGGNDIIQWPKDDLSQQEAEADAAEIAARFRTAMEWFTEPSRFPNGVYVIFAGVYEFTDGTGDLSSCPAAGLIGLSGEYLEGAIALSNLNAMYMEVAVDLGFDMIFLLDEFCGHGYHRDDTNGACYVAGSEQWFDLTCIHPTPVGHARIAEMFEAVVNE